MQPLFAPVGAHMLPLIRIVLPPSQLRRCSFVGPRADIVSQVPALSPILRRKCISLWWRLPVAAPHLLQEHVLAQYGLPAVPSLHAQRWISESWESKVHPGAGQQEWAMAPCDTSCRACLYSVPSARHHEYRALSFQLRLHMASSCTWPVQQGQTTLKQLVPLTHSLKYLTACTNAQHCLHTPAASAESGYSQEATCLVLLQLRPPWAADSMRRCLCNFIKLLPTSGLGNMHSPRLHLGPAIKAAMNNLHPPAAWAARSGCPADCGACARQTAPPHLRQRSSPPSQEWRCRSGGRTACQAPAGRTRQATPVSLQGQQ